MSGIAERVPAGGSTRSKRGGKRRGAVGRKNAQPTTAARGERGSRKGVRLGKRGGGTHRRGR